MASVLIIDEDHQVLAAYESAFRARGSVGVFTAPTLDHARSVLADERVDVVILDGDLKVGSTPAFLDELGRERPRVVPVVVTADASPRACSRLAARGAVRVFRKPCSFPYLVGELETMGLFDGSFVRPPRPEAPEDDDPLVAAAALAAEVEAEEAEARLRLTVRTAAGLAAAVLVLIVAVALLATR